MFSDRTIVVRDSLLTTAYRGVTINGTKTYAKRSIVVLKTSLAYEFSRF